MTDKALIKQLLAQVKQLTARVKELEAVKLENKRLSKRVSELEATLSKYEHPKHSSNSSIAPSQDPFRKTKSLRGKSKKSIGGQKGHKGSQLHMVATADTVITHDIEQCVFCGTSLSDATVSYESRQVFDIPVIRLEVIEHRIAKKNAIAVVNHQKHIFLKL